MTQWAVAAFDRALQTGRIGTPLAVHVVRCDYGILNHETAFQDSRRRKIPSAGDRLQAPEDSVADTCVPACPILGSFVGVCHALRVFGTRRQ